MQLELESQFELEIYRRAFSVWTWVWVSPQKKVGAFSTTGWQEVRAVYENEFSAH